MEDIPVLSRNYSPKSFELFWHAFRKKKVFFTRLGVSMFGKTVPSVLSTALCLRPREVLKTSGTVSSNTYLPAGE